MMMMMLIMLHLYVSNLWRVFSKCSFSDIPHTFIPHFTLHSAENRIEFSANHPLTTFRIPQSPFRYFVENDEVFEEAVHGRQDEDENIQLTS